MEESTLRKQFHVITPIKSCIKTCGCKEGRQTAFSSGSIEQYSDSEPSSATQSTPPLPAAPGKEEGCHGVSDKQLHKVMLCRASES